MQELRKIIGGAKNSGIWDVLSKKQAVQFLNSLDGHLKYVVIMYNILLLIPLIKSSKKQIFFKLKITDLSVPEESLHVLAMLRKK